jgi:hypothetical protein
MHMPQLYKRSLGFVVAVMILASGALLPHSAHAAATTTLFGWAWASPWITGTVSSGTSTIGWISFNSANTGAGGGPHSVVVNSDNTITGWAWSSNIGWIKFGGLSGFPAGGSTAGDAHVSGSTVVGWARACAGTVKSTDPYLTQNDYPTHVPTQRGDCTTMTKRPDGWDGWIELSGTTHTLTYDATAHAITGYAWGANNVGWITFNATGTPDTTTAGIPSCSISSSTVSTPSNSLWTYKLSWQSSGMGYCSGGTTFPTGGAPEGNYEVTPAVSSVYTLSCVPATGSTASVPCQNSPININVPTNTGTTTIIGEPQIVMWANNTTPDPEAVTTIRIRPGQPAKINWKKTDNTVYDFCRAYVGDGTDEGSNVLGFDQGFDDTPHPVSPYIIPSNLLAPGLQYFNMECDKVDSEGKVINKVKGMTRSQSLNIEIRVVDPTIQEI